MHAMLLRVWLRPVSRHERVGEHSTVVCHCVLRVDLFQTAPARLRPGRAPCRRITPKGLSKKPVLV
jgi:hypothetical protein